GPRAGAPTRSGRRPGRAGQQAAQGAGKAKGAGKGPARSVRGLDGTKATPAKAPRAAALAAPPGAGTKAAAKAAATETLVTGVQTLIVAPDEAGMRLDRFLVARFPQLAFTHIQRIVRKGELRVDMKRAKPNDRLEAGQSVRVPPLRLEENKPAARTPAKDQSDAAFLKSITLYEDKDVLVLNKPMGLAVQGGSGTTRHVDGMLEALRDADGQK